MKKVLFTPLLTLLFGLYAMGQCDGLAKKANDELKPYLASGQYIQKYVKEGQIVSLRTTLFEGFKYRIVAKTDNKQGGQVLYRFVDSGRNTVFSNKSIIHSPYWDMEMSSTDNFLIQAKLTKGSGCLVLSIGFDDRAMKDNDDEDDLNDLDDLDDLDGDLDDLDDLDDLNIDDIDLDDDMDLDDLDDLDDPIFDEDEDLFDE